MKIYRDTSNQQGVEIAKAYGVSYTGKYMSDRKVTCTVDTPVAIDFQAGDYCLFEIGGRAERFEIANETSVKKIAYSKSYGKAHQYTLELLSLNCELEMCIMRDIVLKDSADTNKYFTAQTEWTTYGTAQELANRIQANLDRLYVGEHKWTIDVIEEGEAQQLSFDDTNCWNAVSMFNSVFGLKFIIRNRTITVGRNGDVLDMVFEYGQNKGAYNITRVPDTSEAVVTRLTAFGGTRNIPEDYNKHGIVDKSQYIPRLMLPGYSQSLKDYIDSPNIASYGIREGVVTFDEIYPSIAGITAEQSIAAGVATTAEGRLDEVLSAEPPKSDEAATFAITIKDIGFDLNDYLTDNPATLAVKDGPLGGYEFEIASCKKETLNEKVHYRLILNRNQEGPLILPNDVVNIVSGNHFVLLNITMPPIYVTWAEQHLLQKAEEYLYKHDSNKVSYNISIDDILMANRPDIAEQLIEGNVLPLKDADYGIDENILIDSIVVKVNDETGLREYNITLSDESTSSTLDRIKQDVYQQSITIQKNKSNTDREAKKNSQSLVALRDYIFDPDGTINDAFLRIMMLQVGADSSNFRLEKTSFFNGEGVNMSFTDTSITLGSDVLHHYVYSHADTNSSIWIIGSSFESTDLLSDTPYFIAIKADKLTNAAEWIISQNAIPINEIEGKYIFNFGILYPVGESGSREFVETRGMASVYGDTIVAGRIKSLDGFSWWDLTTGQFLLGTPGGPGLSFIGGAVSIGKYDNITSNLAKQLGYENFEQLAADSHAGNTIIQGGYLQNKFVNTDTLVAKNIYALNETTKELLSIDPTNGMQLFSNEELTVKFSGNSIRDISDILPDNNQVIRISEAIGQFTTSPTASTVKSQTIASGIVTVTTHDPIVVEIPSLWIYLDVEAVSKNNLFAPRNIRLVYKTNGETQKILSLDIDSTSFFPLIGGGYGLNRRITATTSAVLLNYDSNGLVDVELEIIADNSPGVDILVKYGCRFSSSTNLEDPIIKKNLVITGGVESDSRYVGNGYIIAKDSGHYDGVVVNAEEAVRMFQSGQNGFRVDNLGLQIIAKGEKNNPEDNQYIRCADGLLIQWGTISGHPGWGTIWYPEAFVGLAFAGAASVASAGDVPVVASMNINLSNSYFNYYSYWMSGGSYGFTGNTVFWMAIGRWR